MSILQFPSGRPSETQPFQFLANLSLQPSSVVTLALSPMYFAFYGTSFFPTPTRVSSTRGTRLAPRFLSLGKYMPSPGHTSAGNHVTFQFPRLSPAGSIPSRRGLFHTNNHLDVIQYLMAVSKQNIGVVFKAMGKKSEEKQMFTEASVRSKVFVRVR